MYRMLYYGGLGMGGLFLMAAAAMFVRFDVPDILRLFVRYSESMVIKSGKYANWQEAGHQEAVSELTLAQMTLPLTYDCETEALSCQSANIKYFKIIQEITLIHSEEWVTSDK